MSGYGEFRCACGALCESESGLLAHAREEHSSSALSLRDMERITPPPHALLIDPVPTEMLGEAAARRTVGAAFDLVRAEAERHGFDADWLEGLENLRDAATQEPKP